MSLKKMGRGLIGSFILAACVLSVPVVAKADDYNYVGRDGGNWFDSVNWAPRGIPGPDDNVIIEGKRKVKIPSSAIINNLIVGPGAKIDNAGSLRVTGKTKSAGLFQGAGTVDIPANATAQFDIRPEDITPPPPGTQADTPPADVVFQPIRNSGKIITNIDRKSSVAFASIENKGVTQIVSDGVVTFKDIKNSKNMSIESSGSVTLAKIENNENSTLTITSNDQGAPNTSADDGPGSSDPLAIHMDDLNNRKGGSVKIQGSPSGRAFSGKSIHNSGSMQISGAQTQLKDDFTNDPGSMLVLDSSASLTPVEGETSRFTNAGTLIKAAGSDVLVDLDWSNRGNVVVEEGILRLSAPSGKASIQDGGVTTLEGGTLALGMEKTDATTGTVTTGPGTLQLQGGTLNGSGIIEGNVLNAGANIRAGHSPGSITINGNFTQTANGTLNMELGGTAAGTGYDQIVVNGIATLAGTMTLARYGDYLPQTGDTYQLLTYYAKVGNFTAIKDLSPLPTIHYQPTITPTYYLATAWVDSETDTAPPVVSLFTPALNSVNKSVSAATGVASDDVGVTSVTGRLYRYANPVAGTPAGYWAGGTTWTPTYNAANNERPATGTSQWVIALPSLPTGHYTIRASAKDAANNTGVTTTVGFYVDKIAPPTLTIATPANGSTIKALTNVNGLVADNPDGRGIKTVTIQLRRLSDGRFWNGTTWTTTTTLLPAVLGGNKWARTSSWPTGTNLVVGNYSATVTATDQAGNVTKIANTFTYNPTPADAPSGGVS